MHRNVEIKAKIDSLERARPIAQRLATDQLGTQTQIDTYFHCRQGRLKLREITGKHDQLIWYCRDDRTDPRPSDYTIVEVTDSAALKEALSGALGQRVVVQKRREIYLYDNVRIHLDDVSGLGHYLEFEAVLSAKIDQAQARGQVDYLLRAFDISAADLLSVSYAELVMPLTRIARGPQTKT